MRTSRICSRRRLPRVARERSEEKRRVYRDLLVSAIDERGDSYDEQLRFLRLIEEVQSDHIVLLRAITRPPQETTNLASSRLQMLLSLLSDMDEHRVRDLLLQLGDLRILNASMFEGLVSGHAAIDLQPTLTTLGTRFIRFLEIEDDP